MENKIKMLFNNEYRDVQVPVDLKKDVFNSIKYLNLVKALLEIFIVSPGEIIKTIGRGNHKNKKIN